MYKRPFKETCESVSSITRSLPVECPPKYKEYTGSSRASDVSTQLVCFQWKLMRGYTSPCE